MHRRHSARAGLTLAMLSAASFGTSGVFASGLIAAGWSPAAAVIARLTIAAVVLTPFAVVALRGEWAQLRRSSTAIGLYGLAAVAGAQLFYFNAVSHLSVGVALLLEYSGTVLVVGWMWLRHGHRPRRLTVVGAALAVVGLALVLDVTGSVRVDLVGVLYGLGAACGLAVYFVLSAGGEDDVPPVVMAWAGMCVGAVTLAGLAAVGVLRFTATTSRVTFAGQQVSWVLPVLGLSLVAAAFAYVSGIGAARMLGAKLSSFVGLAEVLFAVLFAWVLLGQLPAPLQVLGGVVVIAGVALVRIDELRAPQHEPNVAELVAV